MRNVYQRTCTDGVLHGHYDRDESGDQPDVDIQYRITEGTEPDRYRRLSYPGFYPDDCVSTQWRSIQHYSALGEPYGDDHGDIVVRGRECDLIELLELTRSRNIWWDLRDSDIDRHFAYTIPVKGWLDPSDDVRPHPYHPVHQPAGQSGDGPVFCLVHGYTGDPSHWNQLCDRFCSDSRAHLRVLVPGHGLHKDHFSRFSWRDWTEAVGEAGSFLHNDHDTVIGVGLSMGASLLLQQSDHFDAVIAINTPCKIRNWKINFLPLLRLFKQYYFPDHTDKCLPVDSIRELTRLLDKTRGQLQDVDLPALVINCKDDEVVPEPSAEQIHERLPNSTRLTFDRGGHELPRHPEMADELYDRMIEWVERTL